MDWNVQDGIVIQNGAPAIRLDLGGGSSLRAKGEEGFYAAIHTITHC